MSGLRVGCVGTGFIAGRHLAALATFPDVDVVAVADSVPERAREAAAAHSARAYDDGLRLVEQEDLDALWICVPPFAHGELEQAALGRGVPFLVEKPLAHDLDTAVRIADQVADSGVLAVAGYHWRYLSAVEEAVELLRDTPAVMANGRWLDATPPVPWWSVRQRSGGQLIEQTTHLLDLARLLVGEVEEVAAVEMLPTGQDPEAAVPVASAATLRFAGGSVGTVASARVLPARHRVDLQLVCPGRVLELVERSLVDHELRVTDTGGTRTQGSDENPIAREDRAFLDAVAGHGDDVRSPYAQALRSHALACAVDRSAREGGVAVTTGVTHG